MRTLVLLAMVFCPSVQTAFAEDVVFAKTKRMIQDGDKTKEVDCALVFTDDEKIVVRHRKKVEEVYAEIPYASLGDLTYERSTHPRTKTAIFVSPLSLLSKGKKHWLTVDYKIEDKGDFVLLRLDKGEYQQILATLESKTGKKVERVIEG